MLHGLRTAPGGRVLRQTVTEAEDLLFMRMALGLAENAAKAGEIPVGAVIVREGRVIGRGANCRECGTDPTLHAEIVAMREAARGSGGWRLEGCTLYVTLEPCPMCAGALILSRISRLVFGCHDPKAGACGSLYDIPGDSRFNHKVSVQNGIMREECARILRDFFRARRNSRRDGRVVEGGRLEID